MPLQSPKLPLSSVYLNILQARPVGRVPPIAGAAAAKTAPEPAAPATASPVPGAGAATGPAPARGRLIDILA
ncbi:MAG TPA: hypothetical protein VFA50_03285 [Stellaceae bacterium]|nr:hypothetical protein [Stellaceae bacterium]